jgi:phage FluMu gp28-like protein
MRGEPFFLPYQARWIRDNSRLKILEKARQIGMSWAAAYRTVRGHVRAGNRLDSWISSRDELQAKLFLADCHGFASLLAGGGSKKSGIAGPNLHRSSLSLSFANGSTIHSLSSHPDAQAGKRGGRILDEFALHENPRLLYAIALPGITWGGQLEILSTHRGSLNFFNQLIQEVRHGGNPKGFSLHRVTLQDALEQGFLRKLQAKLPEEDPRRSMDEVAYFDFIHAGCPDESTFQQEYMCRPLDDRDAFLPMNLITGCEFSPDERWEIPLPYPAAGGSLRGECVLGVDIGRDRDLTVFWLLEAVGDVLTTRRVECLAARPFAEQEHVLELFFRIPQLTRACIDRTGIGRQFVERAETRHGRYRVEGVTFTPAAKEALAYPLRSAFERRELRIPSDSAVRTDLHSVRREITAAGNQRLSADRGSGGHADRFWALALALHAARGRRPASGGAAGNFQMLERGQRELFF